MVLPPGQRDTRRWQRFGLPRFAVRWPEVPDTPVLRVEGEVTEPLELDLAELSALARADQTSDLHCVTTWSAPGLRWSGFAFRDVYEQVLVPRARPHAGADHFVFRGMDGYRTSLPLHDALASDVLLADRLDGAPLPLEHGAPLRLVAPAHYGFKNVKHLVEIELRRGPIVGSGARKEHPRGRVWLEERGAALPGWAWRRIWHWTLPLFRRWFAWRGERTRPRPADEAAADLGSSGPNERPPEVMV